MAVTEMERKITQIGNSLGMTFPTDLLKHLGVTKGDNVSIEKQPDGTITLRKSNKIECPTGVRPDFFDALEKNIQKYDQTMRDLVDR